MDTGVLVVIGAALYAGGPFIFTLGSWLIWLVRNAHSGAGARTILGQD